MRYSGYFNTVEKTAASKSLLFNDIDEFNFYESLNLLDYERSNQELISENFKKLSIINHPDKFVEEIETAKRRFSYLCLSYFVLSNPKLKAEYDKYLKAELKSGELDYLKSAIDNLQNEAETTADIKFKDFINILKNKHNLISDMTAQTAVGMYYEALDLRNEKNSFEIFLDPEDIKPKVSLIIESFIGFGITAGIVSFIFLILYIIAFIRL